jgi:serine protease Do
VPVLGSLRVKRDGYVVCVSLRAMCIALLISTFMIAELPDTAAAAERGLASVVTLTVIRFVEREPPQWIAELFEGNFDDEKTPAVSRERAHGSAIVIARDGLLITSQHLVERAESVQIKTAGGRELPATIVGVDRAADIALLRVNAGDQPLKPIELGDSSRLRVGELVLAVGDPFGLGLAVSLGVVSAKGKADLHVTELGEMLQTDAAINPGNSGGALLDLDGRLVGMSSAIVSHTGTNSGVGFAIPVETAVSIALALAQDGRVTRAWIGAGVQDLDSPLRELLRAGGRGGVLITDVAEGSPAEAAGLVREDVILAIDGAAIASAGAFKNAIARRAPGTRISVDVRRQERTKSLSVVLGTEAPRKSEPAVAAHAGEPVLGMRIASLDALSRRVFSIPASVRKGAVVVDLDLGGVAELAGFRIGDVIVEIDRHPVISPADVESAWRTSERARLLRVLRGEQSHYLVLPAARTTTGPTAGLSRR